MAEMMGLNDVALGGTGDSESDCPQGYMLSADGSKCMTKKPLVSDTIYVDQYPYDDYLVADAFAPGFYMGGGGRGPRGGGRGHGGGGHGGGGHHGHP